MRPGGDEEGPALLVRSVGIGHVHELVDVEQRDALPVDGYLDLFALRDVAEELPRGGVVEGHLDAVLAIGGEVVQGGDAAAGAEGRPVDALPLGEVTGLGVGGLAREHLQVAYRQPADLGGRVQVGVHERGGEQLDVGDVVEVGALGVEGQVEAGVDPEPEQVVHGGFVLRAVEALEGAGTGVGVARRGLVQGRLERLHQGQKRVARRPRKARGRHHAGAQLHDHALGDLGVVGRVFDLEALQRGVAGQEDVIVTNDAVRLHDVGEALRSGMRGARTVRRECERDVARRVNAPGSPVKAGDAGLHARHGHAESHQPGDKYPHRASRRWKPHRVMRGAGAKSDAPAQASIAGEEGALSSVIPVARGSRGAALSTSGRLSTHSWSGGLRCASRPPCPCGIDTSVCHASAPP